ncbi:hypothetical protein EJB05_56505, partial [Eragrostis curvula]
MAAAVADLRSLPPGYRFVPKGKELIEFYLLPRARGLPDPFPGVDITDDDTAGSTQPWKLFKRHNRRDDDEPYFFVHSNAGARQDRVVDGGFKWNSQKRVRGVLDVGGEKIRWSKHLLSLQRQGDSSSGSGSLGWVMHEYTITEPHCAAVKICQISFTGHGQKRKRIPDGCDDCESEPESQSTCVGATPSGSKKRRKLNQETEQVPGAMEQLQEDDCLRESATQRAHIAAVATTLAPLSGSGSGTTGNFRQEAEQVGKEAEHLDGEDCHGGFAPQCAPVVAADDGSGTRAFDQDCFSAEQAFAHQDPSDDDFIAAMLREMTDRESTLEDILKPLPMVQDSCGMSHMATGSLCGVVCGGFCF